MPKPVQLAPLAFLALLAVLAAVALLPDRRRTVPGSEILLHDARVTLYPEADPVATWRFASPSLRYDPQLDRTVLARIAEGARVVDGEVDFELRSEAEVAIEPNDDLTGEAMVAWLEQQDTCLTMLGSDESPVRVEQRTATFEVPVARLAGGDWGEETRLERVVMGFDLESFEFGGEGTSTVMEIRESGLRGDTACDDF